MSSIRLPILLCLLGLAFNAAASRDSIAIDEVQINAKRRNSTSANSRFSVSTPIEANTQTLEQLSSTSLNDYLLQQTPVYIRQSGAGQSASISTRGTAPTHTSVFWNGLPVSSLTVGQASLNLLPVFFFDNVNVQLGGESSLYGSGSMGGNISLNSKAEKSQGLHLLVQQSIASYEHFTTGVKVGYVNSKIASKTTLLYASAKNDFKFDNTKYGNPKETQNNAGYRNMGVMQNLRYKLSENQDLNINAWYTDNKQQIQPIMPSNLNPAFYDSIDNKSLRVNLSYNGNFSGTHALATIGYCYDRQDFRSNIIATHNVLGILEAERLFLKMLRMKIGLMPQRISPTGDSYANDIVEWRTDLYAMGTATPVSWLQLNLSARQSFITDLTPPFTYAAGASITAINNNSHLLKITESASKTYRAPSINERYWGYSINSYLQPEEGNNIEAGAQYKFTHSSRSEFFISAGAYRNIVNNWMRWMPYGHIWKPVNLLKVKASGLDVVANGNLKISDFTVMLNLNYAYSLVNVVDGGTSYASLNGYQMAYSPKYRGSGTLGASYKNTSLLVNVAYVGLTHSSDIFDIIPAYTLVKLSASQSLTFGKHCFEVFACVNNLLDKAYQSIQYFAMPGRNYELTLKYYFQTNKKQRP
ncbi:MAG: TonB-dependent receptor plug domain-containing protein [Prevotellaceae bacterium]|jgi:iron complex outermembrane receptor protein|nr:TonB-dependent receptor plug domain-containing protein [Prevotellaceae bacterium]